MVIIPDSEFLPVVDSVQLFPESLVSRVVKIQASDELLSIHRIFVPLHHSPQPMPQSDHIRVIDFMLPLVAKIQLLHPLYADHHKREC